MNMMRRVWSWVRGMFPLWFLFYLLISAGVALVRLLMGNPDSVLASLLITAFATYIFISGVQHGRSGR